MNSDLLIMNDKMREYLDQQFESQSEAESNIIIAFAEGGTKSDIERLILQLFKYSRYIRHAILESQDCDHCKEVGLVD
jgi:hypothetical protein